MVTFLTKGIISGIVLVLLYSLELLFPYFETWKGKLKHTLRNGGFIIINSILINLFLVPLIIFSTNTTWGLFSAVCGMLRRVPPASGRSDF